MIGYAFKRIIRSKLLFVILFGGVFISSTTFATITLGTNALFLGMVDNAFAESPFDMEMTSFFYKQYPLELMELKAKISQNDLVQHSEIVTRVQRHEYWGPNIESSRWEVFAGIENDSLAYNGIKLLSGNSTLGPNQVWIVNSSTRRPNFNLCDIFNLTFRVIVPYSTEFHEPYDYPRNLTLQVAGFVTLTDQALKILVEDPEVWKNTPDHDLYITSWPLTFAPEIQITHHLLLGYPLPHAFEHSIMIMLDRSAIINPFDVQGSFVRLTSVDTEIREIAELSYSYLFNNLKENIDIITEESLNMVIMFLSSSIPIFFIALYLGVTMSDVTFNFRRREIGLLVTKGAKRKTVLRIFLTEALLIGLLAGVLSIVIAFLILPILLGPITIIKPASDFSIPLIIVILLFACLMALLSIYSSANHSTKIPTIEALREYSPTTHPSEYNRTVVWIALIAGIYKIIMWLTGINPLTIILGIGTPSLIMLILLSTWYIFDLMLTPIALLLFLYGLSKILIQGSQIIYQASEKLMQRIIGGIGVLATKSIKRSPARTAAIVFMLALVIGYGFQTLSVLASEQDYIYRSSYADVGSDIAASIVPAFKAPTLIPFVKNISGVQSVTAEFWTFVKIDPVWDIGLRAINASDWYQSAYYEENWFSGVPSTEAFNALSNNNHTIILQKGVAATRALRIGDSLDVWRGENSISLIVGGFFGPAEFPVIETISPRGDYSLVSVEVLEELEILSNSSCQLLIRAVTQSKVNDIIAEVQTHPYVAIVDSLQNRLIEYSINPILSAPGNILQIEVLFSFLLASFGTTIIITASLKEKDRELALMAARGSSKQQIRILLLGETILWISFALLIGGFTGLVASYAQLNNIAALDAFTPRSISILLSPILILQFTGLIILLVIFALIPVLQATRRAQRGAEALRQG
ncbi:MAG: FtsX-like permease family protein [Candidatus Odinarchaeota archaeon]